MRATARRARTIIAAPPETAAALEPLHAGRSIASLAIGWSGPVDPAPAKRGPLRAIFVGRLVHWKGLHLGLEATAGVLKLRPDVTLTVVGDGPERRRLEEQASRLGIAEAVSFIGQVAAPKVAELLGQHNCLLFPSFQDSGGFVVLEAMASGLPVICLNSGGPALLVADDSGFRVSAGQPGQVVEDLRDAMVGLQDDQGLRARLGEAGARRVEELFDWEESGELIRDVYRQCLEEDVPLEVGNAKATAQN